MQKLEPMVEEKKKSSTSYRTVVLIDDNEVDNLINRKLLESTGFAESLYVFSSGKSAIEYFKNLDLNKNFPEELLPDLVLLDINMPLMSGFNFIESLEKLSNRVKSKLKVVLLTSSINPDDMAKAKQKSLVAHFMAKPLTKDKLHELRSI